MHWLLLVCGVPNPTKGFEIEIVKATLEVAVVMVVVVGFAHVFLCRVAGQMTLDSKYGQSNDEDWSHDSKLLALTLNAAGISHDLVEKSTPVCKPNRHNFALLGLPQWL